MSTRSILQSKFQIETTYNFEAMEHRADLLSPISSVYLTGPEGIIHYLQTQLKNQSYPIGSGTGSLTAHTSNPTKFLTDVLKTLLELERWVDGVNNIDYFKYKTHPHPLVNLLSRHYNHGRGQTFKDWIEEQCDIDEILKGLRSNNNLGLDVATIRKYENVILFVSEDTSRIYSIRDLINVETNNNGDISMHAEIVDNITADFWLEVKVFKGQIHEALAKI